MKDFDVSILLDYPGVSMERNSPPSVIKGSSDLVDVKSTVELPFSAYKAIENERRGRIPVPMKSFLSSDGRTSVCCFATAPSTLT